MVKLTKNLYVYDCFKKWSEFNVAWIFSDPHFDCPDCKLMDPNWPTPEEQVKLINSKVGKRDLLFILGDICNVEYIKRLKGYKVLVMGNHDSGRTNYERKITRMSFTVDDTSTFIKNLRQMYEGSSVKVVSISGDEFSKNLVVDIDNLLFDEVYEGPLFIGPNIVISHEPIDLNFGINIHGHDHCGTHKQDFLRFNVCSNLIDFTPVRLDKLIDGVKVVGIHRLAINKASERHKK